MYESKEAISKIQHQRFAVKNVFSNSSNIQNDSGMKHCYVNDNSSFHESHVKCPFFNIFLVYMDNKVTSLNLVLKMQHRKTSG